MKLWNVPSLEEMDLKATAYSPAGGNRLDGTYNSYDGKFTHKSFGSSSGDSGTPSLAGNDPSKSPKTGGFVQVN